MLQLVLLLHLIMVALLHSLRLHLGIANDAGSPNAAQPFVIEEPALAKAIYGRLDEHKKIEYYSFLHRKRQKSGLFC